MKKYYPILLSKKGELDALQFIKQDLKDEISPTFKLLRDTLEKKIRANGKVVAIKYNDAFEKYLILHWSFFGNQVIIDFSVFGDVEEKIDDIEKFLLSTINGGVNIVLTIQRNSPLVLTDLIKRLIKDHRLNCCFRIWNDGNVGFEGAKDSIGHMMDQLEVDSSKIVLLFDFGYVDKNNKSYIAPMAKLAIDSLEYKIPAWLDIVVACGSFPVDLSEFDPPHEIYRIERFEGEVWKSISKDIKYAQIKYGDFGTKHPIINEVTYQPTVSVRYTTEKEFIIFKGQLSDKHELGHRQYILHAQKLIKLKEDYSGKDFCWGDLKIYEYAQKDAYDEETKPGSSTTWVQLSQNHHISLLGSLL